MIHRMTQIIPENPPLFDELDAAFKIAGKSVIFAFGDRVYNPQRIAMTVPLMAHEAVHGQRQGSDIMGWWRRYIADPEFRLAEEIPAHRAELVEMLRLTTNRVERRQIILVVALKLCSPLYGKLITLDKAKRALKA